MPRLYVRGTPESRFWARVHRQNDGCWEWQGATLPTGYGRFFPTSDQSLYAHRYSFALANGAIPEGMQVCHRCDNPKCVRPDHLFLGTSHDNHMDMARKGRGVKWAERRTHCKRGHEFTPENTRYTTWAGTPSRACRTCDVINAREYPKRKRVAA